MTETPVPENIRSMDDEPLADLHAQSTAELNRRSVLARASIQADETAAAYLAASGISMGDPWVLPQMPFAAYPAGWWATADGETWESLRSGNMTRPGGDGAWAIRDPAVDEPVPYWNGAVEKGERVRHHGRMWIALEDTALAPTDYPAGWDQLTS